MLSYNELVHDIDTILGYIMLLWLYHHKISTEIWVMPGKLQFCSFPGITHMSDMQTAVSQASLRYGVSYLQRPNCLPIVHFVIFKHILCETFEKMANQT